MVSGQDRMNPAGQFRRRILLVDSNTFFLKACSRTLSGQGYEVVTAQDGFAALCSLRGAPPDLLITELDLPRMSGFEMLSVVRTRFPLIAVIALSGEYTAGHMPQQTVCDAFLTKGPNLDFELIQEAQRLISESPLRGSRPKSDVAPVWIPRSSAGYIVLTCPECLRSFSAVEPKPARSQETCLACGANVPFEMSSVEAPPPAPPLSLEARSRKTRAQSRHLRAESERLLGRHRS